MPSQLIVMDFFWQIPFEYIENMLGISFNKQQIEACFCCRKILQQNFHLENAEQVVVHLSKKMVFFSQSISFSTTKTSNV
jgi:hypothetical protein